MLTAAIVFKKINKPLLILFAGLAVFSLQAKAIWQLEKHQDGIQVFSKAMPNSPFIKIKASVDIGASADQFYHLLTNPELALVWLDKVDSTRLLEKINDKHFIVFTEFSGYGIVKPRAMLTLSFLENRNRTEFDLTIKDYNLHTLNQLLLKKQTTQQPISANHLKHLKGILTTTSFKDTIRVSEIDVRWQVKQVNSKQLQITYTGYFNPNGNLPAAISNFYSIQSIFKSFKNLQKIKPLQP